MSASRHEQELLPARRRAPRGARAQIVSVRPAGDCLKGHTDGRFGSARGMGHKSSPARSCEAWSGVRFSRSRPPAMSAPDSPHDFFGPERLGQNVIPAEIDHFRTELAASQPRGDDHGRRLFERLGSPEDIPPRVIGQGMLTDHDRSELDQIDCIAGSGANQRSTSCIEQDRPEHRPLVIVWPYQKNAWVRRCRGACMFPHVRLPLIRAGAMPFQQALGNTRAFRGVRCHRS